MNSDIKLIYAGSLPDDIDINNYAVSEASVGHIPLDDAPAVTSSGAVFSAISNPDFAYLAVTSKISLNNIPDNALIPSITDGFQTVTFSSPMEKLAADAIIGWGVPPFTEDPTPETLFSGISTNSMTWTLSRPSKIFGVELSPNLFGTNTYKLDYYSGSRLIGSITRTITVPGPPIGSATQGARLFAAITDDAGFDRIHIASISGGTFGFLVAQVRYQGCVDLCNVIIEETKDVKTTLPVLCCVSVPAFEIAEVSSDIKATILSTCCDVQEDFVCPDIGPIAGVKTADVKIFAELHIPVTLRSGGCPSITVPYTCTASVVFTIEDVFVSSEIKNCRVISVSDIVGSDFQVLPVRPCLPHCCITGSVSLKAKVAACVMTSSIRVSKCL